MSPETALATPTPSTENRDLAIANGCYFAEVSAKSGEGVEGAVRDVVARLVLLGEKQKR